MSGVPNLGFDPDDSVSTIPNDVMNCTICEERFVEPKGLPCSHIFCDACIRKWLTNHDTCPTCREKVSVNDLKANYLVKNIVESMREDPRNMCNECDQRSGNLSTCDHCTRSLCQNCLSEHTRRVIEEIRKQCDELISVTAPELEAANERISILMSEATSAKEKLIKELQSTHETLQMQILKLQENSMDMLKRAKEFSHPNLDKRIGDVETLIVRIDTLSAASNKVIERKDLAELEKLDKEITDLEKDIENFQSQERLFADSKTEVSLANLTINPAYQWIANVIEETNMLREIE